MDKQYIDDENDDDEDMHDAIFEDLEYRDFSSSIDDEKILDDIADLKTKILFLKPEDMNDITGFDEAVNKVIYLIDNLLEQKYNRKI